MILSLLMCVLGGIPVLHYPPPPHTHTRGGGVGVVVKVAIKKKKEGKGWRVTKLRLV